MYVDGREGWIDGWMDVWTDGRINVLVNMYMSVCMKNRYIHTSSYKPAISLRSHVSRLLQSLQPYVPASLAAPKPLMLLALALVLSLVIARK